jgi:hypothetical protein
MEGRLRPDRNSLIPPWLPERTVGKPLRALFRGERRLVGGLRQQWLLLGWREMLDLVVGIALLPMIALIITMGWRGRLFGARRM